MPYCRLPLEFSRALSESRIEKACGTLGEAVVKRILAFALFLLGARRQDISQHLAIPLGTLFSLLTRIGGAGLPALEDRRRKDSGLLPPPTPQELSFEVSSEPCELVLKIGDGALQLRIPHQNPLQAKTVLLTLLQNDLLSRSQVARLLEYSPTHTARISRQLAQGDWRQLEFPATTNGIPRFFRADPDHEGMVKDQQVRRLVKLKKNEKTLTMAAAKAGMSRKTARKYLKSGKLPSQCQPERYWRTRSDPFESVWPEVKEILKRSPTVEAKAVFDHLCRQQEGAFQQGQLRTLQRRIKQWKAEYGEAKEVMFPQKYQPGHQAQSDFTFMGRLGVTIQGQPFPHLLYHFVLAYSNWEATTLCFSESFESLSLGLQNALWELGALPEEHRTDRLSAAVKNLKREEFTERYQALLRHFGMRSSRTQAGKAHENGDVEQSHHRLKRAIEQELLLRCSRDFSSREEYEGFVAVIVSRRNAARQKRLGEELAVMRPLPARRLDDFTRQWVRVSPSSTIRVRHNTYSVDSRLIGERVQVRVWADQVEVYYGGRRQARMPRLRGEGKHRIDYRHVIHSLVRKPGAFTRYRWREDLFPGILFRVAYDELRRDCPATADRQYLKILEVAAQEGEQRVREALQVLIERGQRIRFEALRECLVDPVVEPWEVMVEKMDVGLYDTLLENREVRS